MTTTTSPPLARNDVYGVLAVLRGDGRHANRQARIDELALHLRPAIESVHDQLRTRLGGSLPTGMTRPLELYSEVRALLRLDGRNAATWLTEQDDLDAVTGEAVVERMTDTARLVAIRDVRPNEASAWDLDDAYAAVPRVAGSAMGRPPLVIDEIAAALLQHALDALDAHLVEMLEALAPAWTTASQTVVDAVAARIDETTTADEAIRRGDRSVTAWRSVHRSGVLDDLDGMWALRNTMLVLAGYHVPDEDLGKGRERWLSRFSSGHLPLAPATYVPARPDPTPHRGHRTRPAVRSGTDLPTPRDPRADAGVAWPTDAELELDPDDLPDSPPPSFAAAAAGAGITPGRTYPTTPAPRG